MPAHPIDAYEAARASQIFHQQELDGKQPGDPDKAADVLIQVTTATEPPVHLILGRDAYNMVDKKDEDMRKDLEAWRKVATATDIAE